MDITDKLINYVQRFNAADEENFRTTIPNSQALEFMRNQIPLVSLPDPVLEETYYFRWWTFRKHVRCTQEGYIITEFLPDVPWAGPYNAVSCASGFHIREGRWLADQKGIMQQYIRFWLNHKDAALSYSNWLASAVKEFTQIRQDNDFAVSCLEDLETLFAMRQERCCTDLGLCFSSDDRDGMEYGVSGSGIRPTLNSYLCADAYALSWLSGLAGEVEKQRHYHKLAGQLQERLDTYLWNGKFYCTIPQSKEPSRCNVRELIGYIPWYFSLPSSEKDSAFRELLQPDGFAASKGLTTVVQRNPRFCEEFDHECLWNGPSWPYATSQTLVSVANVIHRGTTELTKEDYFHMLRQYAESHYRIREDGIKVNWIDENLDPETGEWIARNILKEWGWRADKGGYERGKDYNHSLYCDLILSGLLGISTDETGDLQVRPLIPDSWSYFYVENLHIGKKCYTITFDRDGKVFGKGKGVHISST